MTPPTGVAGKTTPSLLAVLSLEGFSVVHDL